MPCIRREHPTNKSSSGSTRWPTYLRIVVTKACPLSCTFCHQEGDPLQKQCHETTFSELCDYLDLAVKMGIQKFKFLGGEPLLRKDLPQIIAYLRRRSPKADISLISAGAASPANLQNALASGLDRANLSIHGWSLERFSRCGATPLHFQRRHENLAILMEQNRPLKINYVYTGPAVESDLLDLLRWAADKPVVIGLLDDLHREDLGAEQLMGRLRVLWGEWERTSLDEDPHSLSTTQLFWRNGLRVEIKTEQLGRVAPWLDCPHCPKQNRCREGIFALRLGHTGQLRLCMDREDINIPLRPLRQLGQTAMEKAWRHFVQAHMTHIACAA